MARTRAQGNGRLEELMATLVQTQATMQQNMSVMQQTTATMQQNTAAMQAEFRDLQRQHVELERAIEQRFARIEVLLLEHNRMLTALPEAVRDKIGFKTQPSSP